VFVFLFLNTEYKDSDVLPYAVNVFLRMDPLMAGSAMLAGRAFIWLLWPALALVVLTALFGRFFCAWVCPLGATLDFTSWILGKKRWRGALPKSRKNLKFWILAFLAGSSLFTLQLVFLFDPLCILIRSLTVTVYPAANLAVNAAFDTLYGTGVGAVTSVSEPVLGFLRNHFLAFEQPFYKLAELTGLLFLGLLCLEYFEKRFWCRNLCPLGAMFGLMGRFGLVRRRVSSACTSCGACAKRCEMGAVASTYLETDRPECTACLECKTVCPEKAITFTNGGTATDMPLDVSRRNLIGAFALGGLAVPIVKSDAHAKVGNPACIRPPGALAEDKFLVRCTRCGECMRVCIANGLQPAVFEAGLIGVWSPVLIPRMGYCEYNCTLCGQVCPTGAIRRLEPVEKARVRIGLAEFDRNHCLPWKGDSECIVCEEHCPTPEKAIKLRDETVETPGGTRTFKRPYVDEKLCIGCGICETKCPLPDRSAIVVTSRGESRAADAGYPEKKS
jgi:ferredoxin